MKRHLISLLLCLSTTQALAHGDVVHKNKTEAQNHQQAPLPPGPALPFDLNLGGSFELTDHTGAKRTQNNPDGHMQLLFFGYANCQAICSVALPLMADVVDNLATHGLPVTPLMITVDPKRDTVTSMGPALKKHHPDFIGLTGSIKALENAYDLYSIEHQVVFTDPEQGDVFAHGSHIYLLDAKGQFLTLLPPILSADRIAQIVQKYADKQS